MLLRWAWGKVRGKVAKWLRERALHVPASKLPTVTSRASLILGRTVTFEQWRELERVMADYAATQLDTVLD